MNQNELLERLIRGEISDSTYRNGGKPKGFEIGARVKSKIRVGGNGLHDQIGTIVEMKSGYDILVEFDENIGGHDGHEGKFKNKHCWFLEREDLKLL